ncbi:MAG TPA: hypothetical protein VMU69_22470, partial [Bradyrhizobium sp.]|nr:hypothetical protein [Bradyrhizobium sp.]
MVGYKGRSRREGVNIDCVVPDADWLLEANRRIACGRWRHRLRFGAAAKDNQQYHASGLSDPGGHAAIQ